MHKQVMYIKQRLIEYGHTSEFFLGFQIGLVLGGYRGIELHDDTCKIITSNDYHLMFS